MPVALNPSAKRNFNKVLVTGASQGIGRALAESFASRGADLLLVSRNEKKLQEVAQAITSKYGVKVKILALDLAGADSARKLRDYCVESQFEVDTLVNNAGYGVWGQFSDLTLQEQLDSLQVNLTTVIQLCHEFIPLLRASRARGNAAGILNVSSTTAYQAIPTFAIYAASKSALLSFSRAIHHELKPEGITVTSLVPGTTDSGFIDRAGIQHTEAKAKKVMMPAAPVAEAGVKALERGQIEVIPGGLNVLLAKVTRLLPKRILETAAEGIYKK